MEACGKPGLSSKKVCRDLAATDSLNFLLSSRAAAQRAATAAARGPGQVPLSRAIAALRTGVDGAKELARTRQAR